MGYRASNQSSFNFLSNSMARSECPNLLISLTLGSCLLIGLNIPGTSACAYNNTVEAIQRFYNQVLDFTIAEARRRSPPDAPTQKFFEELDTITGNEDYYCRAYYLFAWINDDVFNKKTPEQWLEKFLPVEKVEIKSFYTKVKVHLENHLQDTKKENAELIADVTHWSKSTDTDNSLIESFWYFPLYLKKKLPELHLMNYEKMIRAIENGEVTGIWSDLQ
ncbi:uncharacterized protein Dana_GF15466 [Drosophila ananassae]|uniref:Uncharacterized protein n=1 Tax=Drosophila ananassae TaxID=7217 RepID=B3ML40_DROAN|nr:uncharacterized protein Dana_GF15466 [Drosophila ananassae]